MYKVIIIDDEKNIVQGLQKFIDWQKLNCKIVGEAYNGKTGFSLAMELDPDIIISDIKMPYIDGLEMISKLKKAGCQSKFIILSGYSDFEYAKRGISLGVNSYVLKPVDEDEFISCLQSTINEIENERKKTHALNVLKEKVNESYSVFIENVLRDVVDSYFDNNAEVEAVLQTIDILPHATNYASLIIEINSNYTSHIKKIRTKTYNLLKEIVINNKWGILFNYNLSRIALIINTPNPIDNETLRSIVANIRYTIDSNIDTPITIGVGNIYKDIKNISKSFEQARVALTHKIIRGKNRDIFFDEIETMPPNLTVVPSHLIKELEDCISSGYTDSIKNIINKIFEILLDSADLSLWNLQIQCMDILLATLRKIPDINIELTQFIERDIMSLDFISKFNTTDELKDWFTNVILNIIKLNTQSLENKNKNIIDDIKKYIQEHYSENLSLDFLSKVFFMNPYYISQLFSKKTNKTYLDYVTEVRIQKAKELLLNTDMMIYEIAQKVGYNNAKYFSRVFEKVEGCNPSVYRKRCK